MWATPSRGTLPASSSTVSRSRHQSTRTSSTSAPSARADPRTARLSDLPRGSPRAAFPSPAQRGSVRSSGGVAHRGAGGSCDCPFGGPTRSLCERRHEPHLGRIREEASPRYMSEDRGDRKKTTLSVGPGRRERQPIRRAPRAPSLRLPPRRRQGGRDPTARDRLCAARSRRRARRAEAAAPPRASACRCRGEPIRSSRHRGYHASRTGSESSQSARILSGFAGRPPSPGPLYA
jgi:hypothetical protein